MLGKNMGASMTLFRKRNNTFKTVMASLVCALASGLATIGVAWAADAASQPPGSAEIFDVVNTLWTDKKYAEADAYVRDLHAAWSNYIPTELTWVLHARRFGTQVEACIERAKALQDALENDIELASPAFMEVFSNYILRAEGMASFYETSGHGRERRAVERNPLNPNARFKPPRRWLGAEYYLYILAPEAVFGAEVKWREGGRLPADKPIDGVSGDELLWQLGVIGTSLKDKMAICQKLVQRMEQEGGAGRIVREFTGASVLYTYPMLVASLTAVPDEAIPALVAFLEVSPNERQDNLERKMAIWALVRIGRADGEVLRALEDCRAAHPDDELGDYAARAIDYLTRRAGK